MSRLTHVLFLLVIGLNIIVLNQSCNGDQNIVKEIPLKERCDLTRSHVSSCMLNDKEHLIYFPDWDKYCTEENQKKLFNMNCEEIKEEFFGD